MAEYRISGVWKKSNGVITHYAFHTVNPNSITTARKVSKADAIAILETAGNTVKTWIWNYSKEYWDTGGKVDVVNGDNGKYLRSYHDGTVRDNLAHLIDFDWISPT
jgi:hypothetical protein